jgi:hypothetical protein
MTPTMEDTFTGVGLRAHPISRDFGLTLYSVVTGEEAILDDPDLQVYASPEALEKALHRGAQCPPGCSRVFKPSSFSYPVRERIAREAGLDYYSLAHSGADRYYLVTDLPILTASDPKTVQNLLARFGAMPVLTDALDRTLKTEPLFIRRKKSVMFGLPTYAIRRVAKTRKAPLRSASDIARDRRVALYLHYGVPSKLLLYEIVHLTRALLLIRCPSGPLIRPFSPVSRPSYASCPSDFFDAVHSPALHCNAFNTKTTQTDAARYLARDLTAISEFMVRALLSPQGPTVSSYGDTARERRDVSCARGSLRSPLVFIYHRRALEVATLLSLFQPLLPTLLAAKENRVSPHARLSDYEHAEIIKAHTTTLKNLYRITRAMRWKTIPNVPHAFEGSPFHE